MEIVHVLLPNLCIGIAGVPLVVHFGPRIGFVLAYMVMNVLCAVGVGIWFGMSYGSIQAGVGGFVTGLIAMLVGLFVGSLYWLYVMEREHQRRHRESR
jgi:hypothetical protein